MIISHVRCKISFLSEYPRHVPSSLVFSNNLDNTGLILKHTDSSHITNDYATADDDDDNVDWQ